MFTISIEKSFAASHQLTLPNGSKELQHRHDWIVVATVSSQELDEMGLVMDFNKLSAIVDEIISRFEGAKLEELDCFASMNCSAENVAKYIYDKLLSELPDRVNPGYVRVTESPGCTAKYQNLSP